MAPMGTLLLPPSQGQALGVHTDRQNHVRWHTQMPRQPKGRVALPLDAFGDGAVTDRQVYYDGKGGADRRLISDAVQFVGKDPLFPKIGGYEPIRSHMSLFPSRKNPAQPALLSRINVLLKESGLFHRELGAGYHAGTEQSEPSRARLDVLRVAFALYSDQASVYRPFLGMVQRVSS